MLCLCVRATTQSSELTCSTCPDVDYRSTVLNTRTYHELSESRGFYYMETYCIESLCDRFVM